MLPIEKQFIINAAQDRVWGLLGGAIYQCLPVEKVDIINERLVNAILRLRVGFIKAPLKLTIHLTEILPPSSLTTRIVIKISLIRFTIEVKYRITASGTDKTLIVCSAQDRSKRTMRCILAKQRREFAEKIFDSIKTRLEKLA